MLAKLAIVVGLGILFFMNPLLCGALALLWWGTGVLARRQGLLPGDDDATGEPEHDEASDGDCPRRD